MSYPYIFVVYLPRAEEVAIKKVLNNVSDLKTYDLRLRPNYGGESTVKYIPSIAAQTVLY